MFAARTTLFAKLMYEISEITLACIIHNVCGIGTVPPHAHIKRGVEPERKSARSFI